MIIYIYMYIFLYLDEKSSCISYSSKRIRIVIKRRVAVSDKGRGRLVMCIVIQSLRISVRYRFERPLRPVRCIYACTIICKCYCLSYSYEQHWSWRTSDALRVRPDDNDAKYIFRLNRAYIIRSRPENMLAPWQRTDHPFAFPLNSNDLIFFTSSLHTHSLLCRIQPKHTHVCARAYISRDIMRIFRFSAKTERGEAWCYIE